MKKQFLTVPFLVLIMFSCTSKNSGYNEQLMKTLDTALNKAAQQSLLMADTLMNHPDRLPQTLNEEGELVTSDSRWWTSGFFPGVLWYLYENTNDTVFKKYAHNYTLRVEDEKHRTWDHDGGFIIFCSYGNGYRLTQNESYKEVIDTASQSLASRFNPNVGCIRSWDYAQWNKQWEYPVIVDNMMNLEMLMWSAEEFDKPEWADISKTHANTTMKNHYRDDYSSYHVVSYDTVTGEVEAKHTAQGYSHESAWARGQSWGLYGFVMMHRESGEKKYLDHAIGIADFLVNHPNLPDDKIPYWDYNAPDIPDAKRDASAAAIMCSALLELSGMVEESKANTYWDVATQQLESLCSDEYLADIGTNGNFILKHGVGNMPNQSEVDVPLTYADYYFLESITRYKNMVSDKTKNN